MATVDASQTGSGVIADLMRRIAQYEILHEALTDAILATPDPAVRLPHETRAKQIRDQIEALHAEIQRLRRGSPAPAVSEKAWRDMLHEIDFKSSVDAFRAAKAKMDRDCGASLLLM